MLSAFLQTKSKMGVLKVLKLRLLRLFRVLKVLTLRLSYLSCLLTHLRLFLALILHPSLPSHPSNKIEKTFTNKSRDKWLTESPAWLRNSPESSIGLSGSPMGLPAFLKGLPEFPIGLSWFLIGLSEFPNGPPELLVTLLEFP